MQSAIRFLFYNPHNLKQSDERLRVLAKKHKQLTEIGNLITAMPYIQPNPLSEKQERLHIPFNLYGIYTSSITELFGLDLIPTYETNGITYPKPCAMMLDVHANILAMIELASENCEEDVARLVEMAWALEEPVNHAQRYA